MVARNAYIVSGFLHLLALGLLLIVGSMPPSSVRPVVRYQPVRLVASSGEIESPAGSAENQATKPKPSGSPEKAKPKSKPARKVKPAEKAEQKRKIKAGTAEKSRVGSRTKSKAGVPGASGIQLDGADFPYPYYLSNIQIKILSNFKPALSIKKAGGLRAVVYFLIDRAGRISNVKLESKSGHFLFDQEAQRAVLRSNPLPALPPAFGSDQLGVHFEFVTSE